MRTILRSFKSISAVGVLSMLGACLAEDNVAPNNLESIIQSVQENGLTCTAQSAIFNMEQEDSQYVRDALADQLGQKTLNTIIDNRERCTVDNFDVISDSLDGIGVIQQPITSTHTVAFIPELDTSSAGWSPISIYRDGSTYDYMCGPWWEFPKDYIAEFDGVTNAYSSPDSLRIMGLNSYGSCYINGSIGSRVYSDNDIRSCFGYWTIWNCGGPMETGDVRVYHY